MPADAEYLSDRQVHVRSNMIVCGDQTIDFASTFQSIPKVVPDQVAIHCVYYAHLAPKDRVERAATFPHTISRLYGTVADMERCHFAECRETGYVPTSQKDTNLRKRTTPTPSVLGTIHQDLGFTDTDQSIRFVDDIQKSLPIASIKSMGIMATKMTAKPPLATKLLNQ